MNKGRFKRKTHEQYVKEVYNVVGDEYTVIGKYIHSKTKIKIRHNICNHINEVRPDTLLMGFKCSFCSREKQRKTQKEFETEVYNLTQGDYLVIGKYINNNIKVKIKHLKCNHVYDVSPSNFLSGKRCPHCRQSKGENKIANWLNNKNIHYIPQYIFSDCKNKKPLRFDFALFDSNDNLICLCEYDGEFHYQVARYSKNKEIMQNKLKESKVRDQIKNKYCQDNQIPLLRIPYWEFNNIELILEDFLSKLIK